MMLATAVSSLPQSLRPHEHRRLEGNPAGLLTPLLLVHTVPGTPAGLALPPASVGVGVVLGILVPSRAVRLGHVRSDQGIAEEQIFPLGQGLQVSRVAADPVVALVVHGPAIRNRSYELGIGKATAGHQHLTRPQASLALVVRSILPHPTGVRITCRNLDLENQR